MFAKKVVLSLAASLLALNVLFLPEAFACVDTTLRDAAFDEARDVHRLCVMSNAQDPEGQEIFSRLETWLKESGRGLNVELVRVDADAPETRWEQYGIPSAPPIFPVSVLAGYHAFERRSFLIEHWEPEPTAEDLAALRSSPAREAIRRETVRRVAVLLYIPGTGTDAGKTQPVIEAAVKTWEKREPLGLAVVRVERSDEREGVLISFTGLKLTGPDWVAVVFGRGKIMQPLIGDEITEAALNELIEPLVGECTCLRSPSSLGVDIPMVWDESLDAAVVRLRSGAGTGFPWDNSLSASTTSSPIERRVFTTTLWTFAALVSAAVIGAGAIVWRKNRAHMPTPRA